ncbi:protein of unknown function DUF368 [Alkalidesulfovibrio alkalitolerans DSM 16529]|jgi:putative membrane protein|uniref:DUF368 domain-containing protein n=1 Tax=Alkalidesulfovibrio alkalitolerans DSM 16529 TaxID=1121439 RepID=S7UEQ5_9BACT|nr:DUF368 domain-containing protein [Alkalidesulfovibrio alkalitolerans]EPR30718.1 protein of unknown function DUF368 [Alkalidesulfovibrio alkalitolerans DSM 16529]
MGVADVIPGVSGGTIAFITGIYDQLVESIRSFDVAFLRLLMRGQFVAAFEHVHFRFLAPLLFGIAVAIVSMARIMHHVMDHYPVQTWALFFGLIAASILVVGRQIKPFRPTNVALVLCGTLAAYWIVGLIPVETPDESWFIFVCGALAICAMILPGISGAFILLVLGKYHFITAAVKNPFVHESIGIIAVFGAGCVVGIMGFSRLLHWLLLHRRAATISILTGFMLGAMRKIWPWKEVLETRVMGVREFVIREANVLPRAVDVEFWTALALMCAGFLGVMLLERACMKPESVLES